MASLKLTERAVSAARAGAGGRAELWDSQVPGLALRVSGRGHKAWTFRYRVPDGRQRRLTLGPYPALSLADARGKALGVASSVSSGGDPVEEKRAAGAKALAERIKTFDDLATAYFTACEEGAWAPRGRRKAASTLAEERGLYRRHIKDQLGAERPQEITRQACKQAFAAIARKAAVQGAKARALTRQIFNYAIAEERVEANPVLGTPAPAASAAKERVLTEPELIALWAALDGAEPLFVTDKGKRRRAYVGPAMRRALSVALLTLQRRSEVIEMELKEIDLDQGAWTIPAERAKNRRAHFVPLAPAVVALLRPAVAAARDSGSALVFPSLRDPNKSMTPPSLTYAADQVFAALGIEGASLHDYRRTGATFMSGERLGVAPYVVSRVLNHTDSGGGSLTTSRHYNLHGYVVEKRRALEAWAAFVAGAGADNVVQMREATRA